MPVFPNQKKSEEGFHSYKKRRKAKIAILFVLPRAFWKQRTPRAAGAADKLLARELHSASQRHAA